MYRSVNIRYAPVTTYNIASLGATCITVARHGTSSIMTLLASMLKIGCGRTPVQVAGDINLNPWGTGDAMVVDT